jgi:hypothetical protein
MPALASIDMLFRAMALGTVITLASACGGPPAPRVVDPESRTLERTAFVMLDREACHRLVARTFPLEDGGATSGKLWVRTCSTRQGRGALDVDVDVLGWQWVGDGSSGFSVHEYVYFRAAVSAHVRATIEVDGNRPSLRVFSTDDPDVTVREIGRVSARASSPASNLLGVASAIIGQSPNALATSTFRSRVGAMIQDRARSGILVALGEARVPGSTGTRADERLLDEIQVLHPGGALISGSYPADTSVRLQFDVAGGRTVLARAVCVDEAATLVDSVVSTHQQQKQRPPVRGWRSSGCQGHGPHRSWCLRPARNYTFASCDAIAART